MIKVEITIESPRSKDSDSIISAWFKTIDCQEFNEWLEKIKSLERFNCEKKSTMGFIEKEK